MFSWIFIWQIELQFLFRNVHVPNKPRHRAAVKMSTTSLYQHPTPYQPMGNRVMPGNGLVGLNLFDMEHILTFYHFSTLRWHRQWKLFLTDDWNTLIVHCQYHGPRCPGDTRDQGISGQSYWVVSPGTFQSQQWSALGVTHPDFWHPICMKTCICFPHIYTTGKNIKFL